LLQLKYDAVRNCEITAKRRRERKGKKRDGVGQAKNVSEIINLESDEGIGPLAWSLA
jgi:hypothetical protein